MQLDAEGKPKPEAQTRLRVHDKAPVRHYSGFLTPLECEHLITLASPHLSPSIIVDPQTGQQRPDPIRTSSGAILGPLQQDLEIHAINMRIALATNTQIEAGEPLAILRYVTGEQYREHHDCLPGEINQRAFTAIAYLNDDYQGGETSFAASNCPSKAEEAI
ncbi:2OG-Fe(II) oxygenase [Sphingopyxis sp. MWB1]|uniref:2OG-Fe(II) oxygenase n=1 Tax=Sphingopyxis sp. MWB1 TaxID=1537715 RepID=UPI001186380E|nr:2OG-Fe(II) oxygenase [Sphingopyxis sp. MWB1]